jgi:hypothetical protein
MIVLGLLLAVVTALSASSCGDDSGGNPDGNADVTIGNDGNNPFGDGGTDGNQNGDGGTCLFCSDSGGPCVGLGLGCKVGGDCCSGNCLGGSCQPPPCVSDNGACTTNAQCCGGTCGTGGTCTPLNTTCKTLGNSCTANSLCCSSFCDNGICAQPSYCGQNGDICAKGADCCGGVCTIQSGHIYGTCGQPHQTGAQCSMVDGVVCASSQNGGDAGFFDSGLPKCGGACCSRDCAPWGPTQVLICQPASGCHPVGDICFKDDDCCGANGGGKKDAGVTTCSANDGGAGVCSNPTGCKPPGDICRLQTNQCNATDECCTGNVQQDDTCHQDNLGIPRCSYKGDAGCIPVDAGTQCASSADCCNLDPCVPDGDGGFTCYPGNCVPVTGPCTTNADCCVGGHCYIQGGQTTGTCQPVADAGTTDGGPPCALYGQTCSTSSDCCNGVPCNNGRCEVIVN